ncbi:MAG: DUF4157 domain-containing protein [Alphaproteobacteria bacterium]|nr:DUF4157 domain-containing protein [Alphaproteobacteria bacterium]
MIRRLLVAAAFGAVAGLAFIALAAPRAAAQSPFEAGNRMLANAASEIAMGQLQFGANTLTATFASALQRSRDTARADSHPIPADIRNALEPFYPDELLKNVRYSIGDTTPAGVAGFAIRNGNAAAVTLVDTIVFKDEDYTKNLALWAHELHHVEQYRDWGLDGFAHRYMFGWAEVEDEASAKAAQFVDWYKRKTGQIR